MSKQPVRPKGTLTSQQLKIMDEVWSSGPDGATVAEIWQNLSAARDMARTTVLTLVSRLEKRGWLIRRGAVRKTRYVAACRREEAVGRVASKFVDEFFGGSASQLVMSLLGSGKIEPEQIRRLKRKMAE